MVITSWPGPRQCGESRREQRLYGAERSVYQAVIRKALRNGNIKASSIDAVECHGTGTPLGDPIEVQALAAAYKKGRNPDHPVVVGSLKSNIGHMESAAGIGGVMKSILALQHQIIPKTLHVGTPNTHIPWENLPLKIATENVEWEANDTPRRVGISSFGFSGTNSHVILEEAPQPQPVSADSDKVEVPMYPVVVSGRCGESWGPVDWLHTIRIIHRRVSRMSFPPRSGCFHNGSPRRCPVGVLEGLKTLLSMARSLRIGVRRQRVPEKDALAFCLPVRAVSGREWAKTSTLLIPSFERLWMKSSRSSTSIYRSPFCPSCFPMLAVSKRCS